MLILSGKVGVSERTVNWRLKERQNRPPPQIILIINNDREREKREKRRGEERSREEEGENGGFTLQIPISDGTFHFTLHAHCTLYTLHFTL